jgi:predicted ATPase
LRNDADAVRVSRFHFAAFETLRALAEGLALCGEHGEAGVVIEEALALDERSGGSFWLPNLLRTKADILMTKSEPDLGGADRLLSKAGEIARSQSSLGWELRVALSRTRLRQLEGRDGEAMSALQEVVSSFTEGFQTSDLRSAAAILHSSGGAIQARRRPTDSP